MSEPKRTIQARRAFAVVAALATSAAVLATPGTAVAAGALAMTGRISVSTTGGAGGATGIEQPVRVSADGRYVAFSSTQPLVAGDTDADVDTFVRDRLAGTTTLVSLTDAEGQIDGPATLCGLSRDARFVGLVASGDSLATPTSLQLYLRDRTLGTTTLVSANTSGDPSDANNGASGLDEYDPCPISDDGRYVAFASYGTNLSAEDADGLGTDVFRRDVKLESTALVSATSGGIGGSAGSDAPAMSADGNVVAFASGATNLVSGDSNSSVDVFVRTMSPSTTTRVSLTNGGAQSNNLSGAPSISADGARVAFSSAASNPVASDTNAKDDVFVRDRSASTTARVSVASDGSQMAGHSENPVLSDDGDAVAFSLYISTVVPGDANEDSDVYLRHRSAATTTLISATPAGVTGDDGSEGPAVSGDGTTVAFVSSATNLVRNDTDGADDVFARATIDLTPFSTVTALVKQQYVDFIGRQPTGAELTEWTARIANGEASPDQVIADFAHGTTWAGKRGPTIRLYWAFFLRAPDEGGLDYWVKQLKAGKTLARVAAQFSTSSEFKNKYGALSNQAFVTKIYQNIFDRDPDAGGLTYWTNKLDTKALTRGDVMVNFSESSEGKRRLAPQTDTILLFVGMLRSMPSKSYLDLKLSSLKGTWVSAEEAQSLRLTGSYAALVTP